MKNAEELIKNISKGKNLNFEESKSIFLSIMNGKIGEDLIYKFSLFLKFGQKQKKIRPFFMQLRMSIKFSDSFTT